MFSTDFDAQMTSARRLERTTGARRLHGTTNGATFGPRGTRRRSDVGARVRVGLHQRRLDRELADGLPVASSPERRLRAAQLAEPESRAMLARSLRRLVADAQARRKGLSPLVAPARGAVLPCEAAMLELAERIDGDDPVAVAGLARTRLLLVDGCGPLYNRAARRPLEAELLAIGDALAAD